MRALGRLLRLSLAPSALADAAAGIVLAAGRWPDGAAPFLLLGASLALYHGGMALNDWADREHDARTRPERPIPSGAVPARGALALGLALLATGVLLAAGAGRLPGALALLLALVVLAYDLGPRGPLSGPLALASARALDLGLGLALGLAHAGPAGLGRAALLAAALGYGGYVFLVSRLGRWEDAPAPPPPGLARGLLRAAARALAALAPAVALVHAARHGATPAQALAGFAALALGLAAARGLWHAAGADPREPGTLVRAMGLALRRLLVATASLALLPGTAPALVVALAILAGYPLSRALRRAFPPS